jgi:dTDP-4-amino-4,6-dideoxygalactose transaminase
MGSDMEVTDRLSAGIIRLPIWVGMTEQEQDYVIQAIHEEIGSGRGRILKAQ